MTGQSSLWRLLLSFKIPTESTENAKKGKMSDWKAVVKINAKHYALYLILILKMYFF